MHRRAGLPFGQRGVTIRSPLARVPCFGAPYALK
nr:MAG TPA: hypothetical protein [Caudoviricetes sp.]